LKILGRIFWASLSDYIGRKLTYSVFFGLGIALYAAAPFAGTVGNIALFVAIFCIILTMYGGGFATIPAYLADLFGTRFVGAIHGRLLTAWSAAGILGPTVIASIREAQIGRGVPAEQAYNSTMYVLAGLLLVGLLCNLLIRPVAEKHYMKDTDTDKPESSSVGQNPAAGVAVTGWRPAPGSWPLVGFFWLLAGLPLLWGVWQSLKSAVVLF